MGRTLEQLLAELPAGRRKKIEARYKTLKQEIEGLRELRLLAGKAQKHVANKLKIKQPSVSKIEQQTDMYLSTLRSYVEAVGGELELIVKLPKQRALRLQCLGVLQDKARANPAKPKKVAA